MKQHSLLTIIMLVVLILSACAPAATQAPPAQPIKIGVLYNLTGGMASLDVPSANGAKLAAKEINAAGGVLGRQLELVVYHRKTDATQIGNDATQPAESPKVMAM